MGKFDKILICSDLDGTLRNSNALISDENIKAINYFKENGGLFTLCTGRNHQYAEDLKKEGLEVNTVLVTLNGAAIYDPSKGKLVYENFMDKTRLNDIKNFVCQNSDFLSEITIHSDIPYKNFSDLPEESNLYKIVFKTKSSDYTHMVKEKLKNIFGDENYFITTSWPEGIEILDKKSTKGECVKIIRNQIHKDLKKIICVGDYENDISMLLEADISYAVENAIPEVKKAADYVTVSNDKHAVARIIEETEQKL